MHRAILLAVALATATACSGDTDKSTASDTETPAACADRDGDACGGCQQITARPLTEDTGAVCYDTGASEAVGCYDTGLGCDDAIHFMRPADGSEADCMWFSNGCTPEGWVDCGWLETCSG